MTDTIALEKVIADRGLTFVFIARYLGIDRKTVRAKIDNVNEFRPTEIKLLMGLLRLSRDEVFEIFFA